MEEKYNCALQWDSQGNDIYTYAQYPERTIKKRDIKHFQHIDSKLNDAYKEIIRAHRQGLEIVSAMGVRALLEGICVSEGIDDDKAWGLNKKIDALQSSNKIPSSIVDGLKGIKFIGDDAAHRLAPSGKNSIDLSIDLLEALLTHLYEAKFDLEHKAERVKKDYYKTKPIDPLTPAPLPNDEDIPF